MTNETTNHAETQDNIKKQYYERLNDYRNSMEYQANRSCAHQFGNDTKTLLGERWEINEEIYMDFLEALPPLGWRGNTFYLREFTFDDIMAKFTKEGTTYFCEFARYPYGNVA